MKLRIRGKRKAVVAVIRELFDGCLALAQAMEEWERRYGDDYDHDLEELEDMPLEAVLGLDANDQKILEALSSMGIRTALQVLTHRVRIVSRARELELTLLDLVALEDALKREDYDAPDFARLWHNVVGIDTGYVHPEVAADASSGSVDDLAGARPEGEAASPAGPEGSASSLTGPPNAHAEAEAPG